MSIIPKKEKPDEAVVEEAAVDNNLNAVDNGQQVAGKVAVPEEGFQIIVTDNVRQSFLHLFCIQLISCVLGNGMLV